MTVIVTSIGRETIVGPLESFPRNAQRAFDRTVQRGAEFLRDYTKKLPPVCANTTGYDAKGIPVDKGQLRQSIQKRRLALMAAGVFPGTNHGVFVHEGTDRMKARPFFDWSLELGAEREIDGMMEETASQLL